MEGDRTQTKYDEMDDKIISLFQEEREAAFRMMYDAYYLPLCLYSVQITYSKSISEDIVQNVFASFWENKTYNRISTSLHAYLFKSVRLSSFTSVERNHYVALTEYQEQSYSPIEDFYDEEDLNHKKDLLLNELKTLPPQEYKVLTMIFLEGKKYKEVAEELDISVNTVKTHLTRAMKSLRHLDMVEILILFSI